MRSPDLLRKEVLAEFYAPAALQSDVARRTFVLPRCSTGIGATP